MELQLEIKDMLIELRGYLSNLQNSKFETIPKSRFLSFFTLLIRVKSLIIFSEKYISE
jgi:hypothetical protein